MTPSITPIVLRMALAGLLGTALMSGCSAEAPSSDAAGIAPATTAAESQDTTIRIGDTTVRATVLQTSTLGELVASKYGIERSDDRVMLLVGLREGESGQAASVPAQVSATTTDLRGQRETIELRPLVSGELVDYVGFVQVTLPDTLRFQVDIQLEDGTRSTMRFSRQFAPH
ncbi:DUF4426 domain-containing protein [Lysobacter sp. A289]